MLSLEGIDEKRRIVMLEFPSLEIAREFYHFSEYTKAIELRKGAAEFESIAIEGIK